MNPLSTSDMLLRIAAAAFSGALVGLERESRGRPAGLRTTILTCVASAIAMMVSELLFADSTTGGANWRPDPARLGAGILTGIGFLGAGTILRHENTIRGITTAATLWFVTVLGLTFGSGYFGLGSVGVFIALVTLVLLPPLEKHVSSDWYVTLTVVAEIDAIEERQVEQNLTSLGLVIKRRSLEYNMAAGLKTVSFELRSDKRKITELSSAAVSELRKHRGIQKISWD
jgi:putative Mg2+ transporter-C (MgtC) family protein